MIARDTAGRITVRATRVTEPIAIDGKLDDHFPLVVWQTGSGTQTQEADPSGSIKQLSPTGQSPSQVSPGSEVPLPQDSSRHAAEQPSLVAGQSLVRGGVGAGVAEAGRRGAA